MCHTMAPTRNENVWAAKKVSQMMMKFRIQLLFTKYTYLDIAPHTHMINDCAQDNATATTVIEAQNDMSLSPTVWSD